MARMARLHKRYIWLKKGGLAVYIFDKLGCPFFGDWVREKMR
jgi:hypothetical protein